MAEILAAVRAFDGVLELAPTAGSAYPEIAWGDHFFYNAPDGRVPRGQPYATIVTKDYPDDTASDLDPPGRWRLNIHVVKGTVEVDHDADPTTADTVLPHPLYARQGWIAIVNPGERTTSLALELLRQAHYRSQRAIDSGSSDGTSGVTRPP